MGLGFLAFSVWRLCAWVGLDREETFEVFVFVFIETGSQYIAVAGLELVR